MLLFVEESVGSGIKLLFVEEQDCCCFSTCCFACCCVAVDKLFYLLKIWIFSSMKNQLFVREPDCYLLTNWIVVCQRIMLFVSR